jgi:ubiquinone/menaquinone biosynthesis C-methylase UbiE
MRWRRSRYRHRFTEITDALIPVYNWGFRVLGGRRHEAFRRHVVELAGLRGDEHVLDVGCGTGLMVLRIAKQHPDCTLHGIDLSPNVIAVAQENAAKRGLAANLCVGSITDLPYPDGTFDVLITNIMYHHLDMVEKRQAVAEIARTLRPGGRYVSAEFGPRARNPVERHLAKGEYTLYPSHLAEAGLNVPHEELSPFVWGLQVYYRVAVKPDEVAPELHREERI